MGRSRRIVTKTRSFDKAGDATAFFKEMLSRYAIGDQVSAEDALDLSGLLDRHSERDKKIGAGIIGFEVNIPPDDTPQFSQRCFWAVRNDGTKIDFSIGHCLKAQPYD